MPDFTLNVVDANGRPQQATIAADTYARAVEDATRRGFMVVAPPAAAPPPPHTVVHHVRESTLERWLAHGTAGIGIGALLAAVICGGGLWLMSGDTPAARPPPMQPVVPARTDHGDIHGAWAYMQQFVSKRLAAPRTAVFPSAASPYVTDLGDGRYRVKAYVDAQNALGAEVRTHFEGVIVRIYGGWRLESLAFDE